MCHRIVEFKPSGVPPPPLIGISVVPRMWHMERDFGVRTQGGREHFRRLYAGGGEPWHLPRKSWSAGAK